MIDATQHQQEDIQESHAERTTQSEADTGGYEDQESDDVGDATAMDISKGSPDGRGEALQNHVGGHA